MESDERMIGLAEAAAALRIPYQDAHRLLMVGTLEGKKVRGRWLVLVDCVERLRVGEVVVPRSVTG